MRTSIEARIEDFRSRFMQSPAGEHIHSIREKITEDENNINVKLTVFVSYEEAEHEDAAASLVFSKKGKLLSYSIEGVMKGLEFYLGNVFGDEKN